MPVMGPSPAAWHFVAIADLIRTRPEETCACFPAGGCAAMIRLLEASQAAAQDAAIFTIASLIKWNVVDVQTSFARNRGEAVGLRFWVWKTSGRIVCASGAHLGEHPMLAS